MQEIKNPPKRDSSIDLLKTIAIFCVLLIHTASTVITAAVGTADWYGGIFWGCISRFAVPVFFMCSGALMLRPGKQLYLKRLWGKNILRLVLAMLFWALCYKCFHLLAANAFSLPALWQAVKEILLFNQEFHLYYLHMILLVYALLPVLRLVAAHADKKLLQYLLLFWFILGILYPTLSPYWPFNLLTGIPAKWMLNSTYSAMGYCFLGYYMSTYPPRKKGSSLLLFLLGFAATAGSTILFSLRSGVLEEHFLEGMGVCVFLMAAGIFGLCLGFSPKERGQRFYLHLSKASFCVYLVHAFLLPVVPRLLAMNLLPPLFSIPLLALANLGVCLIAYEVLSRIPVVNKWLI